MICCVLCIAVCVCVCRGLLSGVLREEVRLAGIVVGADPFAAPNEQLHKLHCCLTGRFNSFNNFYAYENREDDSVDSSYEPHLFLTAEPFQSGKCLSEAAQLGPASSSSTSCEARSAVSHDVMTGMGGNACVDGSLSGNKRPLSTQTTNDQETAGCGRADDKAAEQWPRLKSSGTSLNWIADVPYTYALSQGRKVSRCDVTSRKREVLGGSVEVTIAATGRPQGYVPPKPNKVQPQYEGDEVSKRQQKRMESRVCRRYVCI
jgi:hypothetical protein